MSRPNPPLEGWTDDDEEEVSVLGDDGAWAILELLGHRRLAGRVSEVTLAGTTMLRLDVPSVCEGPTARWCPLHGDCTCTHGDDGGRAIDDPACPLHAEASRHGEEFSATQFYGGGSVYCLTPTTEMMARAVAVRSRPEPVARYELDPPRRPVVVEADSDEEDEEKEARFLGR